MPGSYPPDKSRYYIIDIIHLVPTSVREGRGLDAVVTVFVRSRAKSLFPSFFGGLDDEGGNVLNVFIGKTSTEGRHGVLSVGDLSSDRFLGASTGKVLVKGFLLEGLFRHDDVLSSGVASSAVGIEDLFSGTGIGGHGRGDGNSEGNGSSSGGLFSRRRQKWRK